MIQTDVHMHPASGSIKLVDKANNASDLNLMEGDVEKLEGTVACLTFSVVSWERPH